MLLVPLRCATSADIRCRWWIPATVPSSGAPIDDKHVSASPNLIFRERLGHRCPPAVPHLQGLRPLLMHRPAMARSWQSRARVSSGVVNAAHRIVNAWVPSNAQTIIAAEQPRPSSIPRSRLCRRVLLVPSTRIDNPGTDCRGGLTSRRDRSHCGIGAARGSRVCTRVQNMKATNCAPMTCQRCGDQRNVQESLTTPFAQYWRCAGCGEVWAVTKSTWDSTTSGPARPRSIGTVKRFFTDTRTLATGAVLTVFGVLYLVGRKYVSQDTASKH